MKGNRVEIRSVSDRAGEICDELRARVSGFTPPGLDHFAQFAIEHLSDAIYWMEEDASIIYVNEAASRLVGYSTDELQTMKVYELNVDVTPETWPAIWALLKAERRRTFEARHQHKNGSVLDVEITAHFLELGGLEYSCAMVRDIRERKLIEQRLRDAEKMEAIGRLAGGVAHDFNNQLAGILGYADVLRLKIADRPDAVELVDQLSHVVREASGVTSRLLAFSRRGKFLIKPVDMHGVLSEVAAVLSRSIDRRVRIETEMGADRTWVAGDPSQLENIFLNLGINARDAMPEGGKLTFATKNLVVGDAPESGPPPDLQAGTYLVVTVTDTGVGIDRASQAMVFEPFFTTKEKAGGTGLGLAAVYGTVKNHKGAIVVDSELGKGTCFTLYLPVIRPTAQARDLGENGEPLGQRLSGHVLLVEDEPGLRDVCSQMLESLGCTVETAADGDSAIRLYREGHARIDVVLLDLLLPKLSGPEVFRKMIATDPGVQVLVMSGFSLDGEAQSMIDKGARGFLQKPFTLAALAAEVGRALR